LSSRQSKQALNSGRLQFLDYPIRTRLLFHDPVASGPR
jgi:hypothetical protein